MMRGKVLLLSTLLPTLLTPVPDRGSPHLSDRATDPMYCLILYLTLVFVNKRKSVAAYYFVIHPYEYSITKNI